MMLGLGANLMLKNGGGGAAFSPTDIAGLLLWLDASQIVGLNDGDPVSTWTDLSYNNGDATQSTGSKKPTFKIAVQNGRNAVRFDGVDDYIENSIWTGLSGVSAATVLAVCRTTTANDYAFAWHSLDRMRVMQGTGQTAFSTASATIYGSYPQASTSTLVNTCIYDGSASGNANRLRTWIDGSQQTLSFTGTVPATLDAGNGHTVGGQTGGGGGYDWSGDVCEVIVYGSALSDANRQLLESYLRTKWGTP